MHGQHDIKKFTSDSFPLGNALSKDDYVIITGDFGLFYRDPQTPTDKHWLDWLNNKPWTTLFLRGNHDNPHLLETLPVADKFGGKVGIAAESVFFLRDGEVYTIENKTFFVYGGAMSTDKKWRTAGEDWWADEIPSEETQEYALENLRKHNQKVDYVLTHTAPKRIIVDYIAPHWYVYMERAIDPVAIFLDIVEDTTEFSHWFFGHFHHDEIFEDQFHLLFNDIYELQ